MCDQQPPEKVPLITVARHRPLAVSGERRSFLRVLTGTIVALITFPATWARAKKVGFEVAKVAELQKVGGQKMIPIKGINMLVIRDSETTVKALDSTCTHKKCEVKYKPDSNDLFCKCHKSKFLLDGKVVGGPAPKPLTSFPAELANDKITITLPD